MHWYKSKSDGSLHYVCQDEPPEADYLSGPPPVDGKLSNMRWDPVLGRVRAKTQVELDADAQAELEKTQAQEAAKQALEGVSPVALNQLAQGFVGQLDQVNLTADAKQALTELILQAVDCIGQLRDLVVLNMGGSRG